MRLRLRGVLRRLREIDREREVDLELVLNQLLVVGEDEAAARTALVELGRPGERLLDPVRPVGELTVGRVELGRKVGIEALYGGLLVGTRERDVDRVVARRGLHLPALRIQQGGYVGVVADREAERDPLHEPDVGPR